MTGCPVKEIYFQMEVREKIMSQNVEGGNKRNWSEFLPQIDPRRRPTLVSFTNYGCLFPTITKAPFKRIHIRLRI